MRRRALGLAVVTALAVLANAAAASAATLYVDDTGTDAGPNGCTVPSNPCRTIEQAHDQPGTGNVIHLGGGTYAENVAVDNGDTLMEDSSFYPGAAGQAVIDNSPGVTTVAAVTLDIGTVSGLTIASDYRAVSITAAGTLSGNTFASDAPSGPYNADVVVEAFAVGAPAITGNTFVDPNPESVSPGQAALVLNSAGSPVVSGNSFSGFFNAILALSGGIGTPTISGNVITGTHDAPSAGAAVSVSGLIAATLTGNSIHSPGAGSPNALFLGSTGGATLSRNRIIGHNRGIDVQNNVVPVTLSSDLVARATTRGLTISSSSAGVNATNVTIVDSVGGGDIQVTTGTTLTLDSSIVGAGTGPHGIDRNGGGTCVISFSRGSGDSGGGCDTGFTSTADPLFVNPAADNYHLAAGSPMIDAGNTAPAPGALDIDGDPRELAVAPQCTTPPAGLRDIGADEFITTCPPPPAPPSTTPPVTTPPKKCKKGQKLKQGKCVKKKRKKRK